MFGFIMLYVVPLIGVPLMVGSLIFIDWFLDEGCAPTELKKKIQSIVTVVKRRRLK